MSFSLLIHFFITVRISVIVMCEYYICMQIWSLLSSINLSILLFSLYNISWIILAIIIYIISWLLFIIVTIIAIIVVVTIIYLPLLWWMMMLPFGSKTDDISIRWWESLITCVEPCQFGASKNRMDPKNQIRKVSIITWISLNGKQNPLSTTYILSFFLRMF